MGEGKYNLNDLKEIKVTEDYLGLDQNVRKCQHNKPLHNCTTENYLGTVMRDCGCFPLSIKISNEVWNEEFSATYPTFYITDN